MSEIRPAVRVSSENDRNTESELKESGANLSREAFENMAAGQSNAGAGGNKNEATLPELKIGGISSKAIEVPADSELDSEDWRCHNHKPDKNAPGEFMPLSPRIAPDPRVAEALEQISGERIKDQIAQISGAKEMIIDGKPVRIESRSTYGEGYKQALGFFKDRFEKDGYKVSIDTYTRYGKPYQNLRAVKEGNSKPNEIVMYGAHIDSTAGYPWGGYEPKAPGADDDGSGAAAISEIAHAIKDLPLDRTVVFSLFSGEEEGLWGSRAMAEAYRQESDKTKIVGMLQMDMVGYSPDNSKTVESHDTRSNEAAHQLTNVLNSVVQQYKIDLKVYGAHNDELTNRSDHYPFHKNGVPAILITEPYDTAARENPNYHSTTDTVDKLNIPYITNVSKMAAAAGVELAGLQSSFSRQTIKDNVIQMMPLQSRILKIAQ